MFRGQQNLEAHEAAPVLSTFHWLWDLRTNHGVLVAKWRIIYGIDVRVNEIILAWFQPFITKAQAKCTCRVYTCTNVCIAFGAKSSRSQGKALLWNIRPCLPLDLTHHLPYGHGILVTTTCSLFMFKTELHFIFLILQLFEVILILQTLSWLFLLLYNISWI